MKRLIEFTHSDNRIAYAIEIRQNYLKDNSPNYDAIIYKGLPMDVACNVLDKADVTKFLCYAIGRCVKTFNVNKNMNEDQIIDLAVEWIESYSVKGSFDEPTIRLEEIITFLELAKSGRYGYPFDRIDSSILQQWFEKYYSERRKMHFDKIDSERYNPEQKTMDETDLISSKLLSLAGSMSAFKDNKI